jgi:hypothetical protein
MPNKNPFPLWGEDPESIVGRNEEIRLFKTYLGSLSDSGRMMVMINGPPGRGKTLLMRRLRRLASKEKFVCPYIRVERRESSDSLMSRLRHETMGFLQAREQESTRPELFRKKIQELETVPDASLTQMTDILQDKSGRIQGAVFFIDDLEKVRNPDAFIAEISEIAREGRGFGIVLSCGIPLGESISGIARFNLGALTRHDVEELVAKGIGKGPPRMGEKCMDSIMADTGGNPRLVRTALWLLFERLRQSDKIITKRHYLAAKPVLIGMLGREWFGRMYNSVPGAERKILMLLAESDEALHVSDISDIIGRPMGQTTALIGRLLRRGQIIRAQRGAYRIFAPLYGQYIKEISDM